ncbi:hypothetical protein BRARA_F03115 [Brassica rapa]|uniref:Uncharacterized protein n=1 Tax=Brassica campestris TaxID=3711 RepID=A0A397Z6V6_BRACM|nr:hypothetical protein BRARA_F03115 [Brassica rapa]
MATSEQSPSYNVFVYGSFQEPAVTLWRLIRSDFLFLCSHLYRLKGRLHPCISPFESGLVNGKEWKRLHMDKFIEASKKFIEWKKNPDSKTREEFEKFVHEDPPVA